MLGPHLRAFGSQILAPGLQLSAGATIAAETGATTKQLMAIFGWDSIKQAERYTRATEQKRMAADAMHLIEARATDEA